MLVEYHVYIMTLGAVVIGLIARSRGRWGVQWGLLSAVAANTPRFFSAGESAFMGSMLILAGAAVLLFMLPRLEPTPSPQSQAAGVSPVDAPSASTPSGAQASGFVSPVGAALALEIAPKDLKECPYCAELIKAAAIKCKHCGSNLSAIQAPANPTEYK